MDDSNKMIIGESSGDQKTLTNATVQNYLKILTLCSKYSSDLAKIMIDFDIFKLVEVFLPS
jgi:hypothetical protein